MRERLYCYETYETRYFVVPVLMPFEGRYRRESSLVPAELVFAKAGIGNLEGAYFIRFPHAREWHWCIARIRTKIGARRVIGKYTPFFSYPHLTAYAVMLSFFQFARYLRVNVANGVCGRYKVCLVHSSDVVVDYVRTFFLRQRKGIGRSVAS